MGASSRRLPPRRWQSVERRRKPGRPCRRWAIDWTPSRWRTARPLGVARSARASESDLWRIYEQRDYFALRERLPPTSVKDTDRVRFLRAATEAAFGDHVAAKRTLHQLLARKPDRAIDDLARRLLMREERAEYHYRAALAAIEPLLPKDAAKDGPQLADLRNVALLLEALADVPPQTAERGSGPAAIRRDADGRFP